MPANNALLNLSSKQQWYFSGSVALYIIFVFNFLQPFNVNPTGLMPIYRLMLCTYGLVSGATVLLFIRAVTPWLCARSKSAMHASTLTWMLALVLLISLSNWLYSQILHYTISGWHNMYVPDRGITQLFPKFIAIYAIWGGLCWYSLRPQGVQQPSKETALPSGKITLHSDNQSDHFRIEPNHVICFHTCDNYLEIYYLNESEAVQKRLIRSSMKKMQEQLAEQQINFYRVHQSYLVNFNHIKGIKKRPSTTTVEVAHLDFDIPVSKKNVKPLIAQLSSGS